MRNAQRSQCGNQSMDSRGMAGRQGNRYCFHATGQPGWMRNACNQQKATIDPGFIQSRIRHLEQMVENLKQLVSSG